MGAAHAAEGQRCMCFYVCWCGERLLHPGLGLLVPGSAGIGQLLGTKRLLIYQMQRRPVEARWRLSAYVCGCRGLRSICVCVCMNISAERNALRSARVIINGCQRLFSRRRRWQTALQKLRECVNASQGWMRVNKGSTGEGWWGLLRNIHPNCLWQMIQVMKLGRLPSYAVIWGILGHLCKLYENNTDHSTPSDISTRLDPAWVCVWWKASDSFDRK